MIKRGTTTTTAINRGGKKIIKIMRGSVVIWASEI